MTRLERMTERAKVDLDHFTESVKEFHRRADDASFDDCDVRQAYNVAVTELNILIHNLVVFGGVEPAR